MIARKIRLSRGDRECDFQFRHNRPSRTTNNMLKLLSQHDQLKLDYTLTASVSAVLLVFGLVVDDFAGESAIART